MAVQPKVYPGELPPIPPGPDAEAELIRRKKALLDYFDIDFAKGSVSDVARTLLARLIEKHKPAGMQWVLRALPGLDEGNLNVLLREFTENYLPRLRIQAPANKGGRPPLTGDSAWEAHQRKSAVYTLWTWANAANDGRYHYLLGDMR